MSKNYIFTIFNNSTPKVLRSTAKIPDTPALDQIGCGTGADVFNLERDEQSPWAAKIIMRQASRARKQLFSNRLKYEAKVLASLNHPNIIEYRAFAKRPDGREVLLMKQCGQSLYDLIEMRVDENLGLFPTECIIKVAIDIARALKYLHSSSILHGDIKSGNMLVKNNFEIAKLCDFGVSLPLKGDGTVHKGYRYSGILNWSPPEEVLRCEECAIITTKADIFSYSLVLWEMMALSIPNMNTALDETYSPGTDCTGISEDVYANLGQRSPLPKDITSNPKYSRVIELFEMCTVQE